MEPGDEAESDVAAASASLGDLVVSGSVEDELAGAAASDTGGPAVDDDEEMPAPGDREEPGSTDNMDVDESEGSIDSVTGGDGDGAGGEVAPDDTVPVPTVPGSPTTASAARPRRPAATLALARIADFSAEDLRPIREPRKRRVELDEEDLEDQQEEDEAVDEIAEVRCLTEREDRDGERWYRVRWMHVKEGEQAYAWVREDDVAGAPSWKSVVDRYYDVALPKNPGLLFTHFIDQDYEAITMGDSKDYSCVYTALSKIMELQGSEMRITTEMVADFEHQEGFDRTERKGLRADQIQRIPVGRPGSRGSRWRRGGIPGVYFVGTLEPPRVGHCLVVEVTDDRLCFAHEGGLKMGLKQYGYAQQIRWVRRCEITDGPGKVSEAAITPVNGVEEPLEAPAAKQARRRTRNRRSKRARKDLAATLAETEAA
ncbi:hypothetical protein ON010_g18681 [Phytophthora cinnamomi]|nr:hypothetical protein ON010_g18681 [Phytophthora cinnamomi]